MCCVALLFLTLSGPSLRRRSGVIACGLSAAVCALAGLVLALLGIADQDIGRVVSGLGSVLTACAVSLATLLAVANPFEDARLRRGEDPVPLNKTVWILLPGVTLVLLLVVLGVVMTPMQAPAASRADTPVVAAFARAVTGALRPVSAAGQHPAR